MSLTVRLKPLSFLSSLEKVKRCFQSTCKQNIRGASLAPNMNAMNEAGLEEEESSLRASSQHSSPQLQFEEVALQSSQRVKPTRRAMR